MSIEFPRDPKLIIDDLAFRASWLEATVQFNIKRLQQIAERNLATPEALRQAAKDLADDTVKNLTELQICAVDRMLAQNLVTAEIVNFTQQTQVTGKSSQPGLYRP